VGLPRELRLRHRKDFDAVFRQGRAWNDQLLVLRALPNNLDHNRFGFVTSKRLGGAVVRNRVRRRLREITRLTRTNPGFDVVLSAKTKVTSAEFADVKTSVIRLLDRAGIRASDQPEAAGS